MSVIVLLDLKLQPDKVTEFTDHIASIIHETREYDGCEEMTFASNQDDPTNVYFLERWESREKYESYFAWRVETGALEKIAPMLAAEPAPRYLDLVDM